ncbi:MAG: ribonuclease [Pseudomonadota bacterium]|jgi:guanyl-specific ribonuclease Sa|nr:ribonuclease [Xanthomonadaceae bacterium]MDE2249647.1 ribonuclease [Xanthomonadaceae bacterium]MDE3211317.1 ribonuclease [Pseudomonadota bacterium]
MRKLNPVLLLAALVFALVLWQRHLPTSPPGQPGTGNAPGSTQLTGDAASNAGLPAFLPAEARDTIDRIMRDGPFEHRQDGVVFGNYEGLLPARPRGYYHEYTVDTPGARSRGARRIITGGTPPTVFYYTGDHYRSFRPFQVRP